MAGIIPPQAATAYTGVHLLVQPSDLTNDQEAARSITRQVAVSLVGPHLFPRFNPPDMSIAGNAISAPSMATLLLVTGAMCDSYDGTGSTTLPATVPSTTGTDSRTDALYARPVRNAVNTGVIGSVRNNDGSINTSYAMQKTEQQYQLLYVRNSTLNISTLPAPPAAQNWVPFVSIQVASSGITSYQVLFPTIQQVVNGFQNPPVATINSLDNAVTLQGDGAVTVSTNNSTNLISLDVPVITNGAYVGSLNGHQGATSIAAGNSNTLHDLGSGALRIDGPSFNAGGAVNFAFGSPDGNGNQVLNVTCPILDTGAYASSVTPGNGLVNPSGLDQGAVAFHTLAGSQATGGPYSYAGIAGNVYFTKNLNYGSNTGTLLVSPATLSPMGSLMGSITHHGDFGGNQAVEFVFRLQVRPGLGSAVAVGGQFTADSQGVLFALDGTTFYSTSSAVSTIVGWSVNIPNDGAVHTLIFHFNHFDSQHIDMAAWIPADGTTGGMSGNFQYIGV